jgi:outer membrane PBP1 activator LpoA protein
MRLARLYPVIVLALILAGCGGDAPVTKLGPLGAQELAELLEGQSTRNDPQKQTEIALGEFFVTHDSPLDYELVTVRFKAFAVVPQAKEEETTKLITQLQQRLRDAVIRVVKEADYAAVQDPSLAHLRSEMSLAVNQTIRRNHVRGVVFSDYTVDKG